MGLPFLRPYLAGQKSDEFKNGVNFAVSGIDTSFFKSKGIIVPYTNVSLGTEIQWFNQLLPSLCSNPSDCKEMLRRSLFVVGEIGGNDYNYFFLEKRKQEEIESLIPIVVGTIGLAVEELIKVGATTLVIPGNLPIGCYSIYLTLYQSNNDEIYDQQTGCINWLNDISRLHNNRLKLEIIKLQKLHPEVTIIYGDYYEAAMGLFSNPTKFGFGDKILSACCGGGGPYNFNSCVECGKKGTSVCEDPSKYVLWDGLHMTEAAYSVLASIPIFHTCTSDDRIGFV